MALILIVTTILFLYLRTWKYKWNIDDQVPRQDYLWVVFQGKQNLAFTEQRRSLLATFTNIGTYIMCCFTIYLLWGWKVALLYSVMPTNVSGVAWGRTGNYYMSTTFLVLVSYFFLTHFQPWGIILCLLFFWAALESTVSAIPFVGIAFFYPLGYLTVIPLLIFMFGKRFRTGISRRKTAHEKKGIQTCMFSIRNLTLIVGVMAYYITLATGFTPLGFFHTFGSKGRLWKFNSFFFMSLILVLLFIGWGLQTNLLGLGWWLMFIGIFCQVVPNLGQFVTERYMYIANIGFCLLLCSFFEQYIPEVYYVLIGIWLMRSLWYIPAWRSNEALFAHGVTNFPDCGENYVNLGSYYIDKKDYFRAIQPLQAALKNNVANPTGVYVDLADCFASCGFYDKALYCTKEALKTCRLDDVEPLRKQKWRLEDKVELVRKNKKYLKKRGIL